MNKPSLESFRLPHSIAIALLWASLMGLYIYNDYFSLYLPDTISNMSQGIMGPLGPATDGVLLGVSTLLAIPAIMIFLSAGLPSVASKWLNIILGTLYTAVNIMTFFGSPLFYKVVVCLEIGATVAIVVYALRWPKQKS